ncbi:MAG: polysaccharide biosynthesis protein [Lautropia sp.]|nr:polysaccharide biosynthesis protein [Lautropia sp.]
MRLFNVNPRTFIAIGHDIIVAALVWSFTFSLRWNFDLDRSTQILLFQTLPAVLAVQVGCFVYFGLYRGIWRYASIHDMRLIAMAVGTSALIIPILLLLWRNGLGVPRSLYFLNPLLLILFMCAGRLFYRWWKEKAMGKKGVEPQPVLLLGAGTAALSLIDELNRNPYWYVIGVLDDNPNKVGRQLGGVRILGSWEELEPITRDSNCKHAVLAVGATNHATRRRVFELCERAHVKLLVIPDVQELMSGQVKVSQIRYVEVDDLLGRDPVSLDTGGLRHMLQGKSVLVTGGGGSIGSELCRQIARFEPAQIVIYELSEYALYRACEDLKKAYPTLRVVPVLGDIKESIRLQETFERHKPTIVYHAAAYKHVPILEEGNAWQSVRNNAYGTRVLADVASRFEIERFVYISSDKAVNPTNVMGATKRLAEMILQYLHSMATLPVVMVRFGNVLGSSGSVIPKFREQIANGGPLTVTHPDITRYFMSIPEATQLVLQAGLMGRGGETFVLDMGQPIRIVDLARTMIKLSGYTEAEIPIAFTGLRPGEKLYEELLADNEKTLPTPHAKLRVSRPIDPPGSNWDASVQRWLDSDGPVGDAEVRQMLKLWVPEYRPASLYRGPESPDDDTRPPSGTPALGTVSPSGPHAAVQPAIAPLNSAMPRLPATPGTATDVLANVASQTRVSTLAVTQPQPAGAAPQPQQPTALSPSSSPAEARAQPRTPAPAQPQARQPLSASGLTVSAVAPATPGTTSIPVPAVPPGTGAAVAPRTPAAPAATPEIPVLSHPTPPAGPAAGGDAGVLPDEELIARLRRLAQVATSAPLLKTPADDQTATVQSALPADPVTASANEVSAQAPAAPVDMPVEDATVAGLAVDLPGEDVAMDTPTPVEVPAVAEAPESPGPATSSGPASAVPPTATASTASATSTASTVSSGPIAHGGNDAPSATDRPATAPAAHADEPPTPPARGGKRRPRKSRKG